MRKSLTEKSAYPFDSYRSISRNTNFEFTAITPYPEKAGDIIYGKEDVPDGVTLYPLKEGQGVLDRAEYDAVLAKSKTLIGIGFPGLV